MNERVLVVDDDDAILRLVCPLLAAEELEPECVKSGVAAMELLDREEFSVVLLDLRMPAGDGFSVIDHLETLPLQVPPIVLVISAYADDQIERDLRSTLVTGVIRKPFDATNLGTVVKRYVSKYERERRRSFIRPAQPPS